MEKRNLRKLTVCMLICLSAGWLGSVFTSSSVKTWYFTIAKPSFNPPSWVFGPVWTLLFIMMGISIYFIVKNGITDRNKKAVYIFAMQLLLNIIWSMLFFGMKSPMLAFFEIIVLWLAIAWTMMAFIKLSKKAAYLLIPYILWVSFAALLNFGIWILN